MAYVIAATWTARDGEEEKLREIIETMTPLSRAEPGCLFYQAHRSPDDPRVFFLYEQYADEQAARQHTESEHFKQHVLGDAVARLENRVRAYYWTID